MTSPKDTNDAFKSLGKKLKSVEEESKRKSRELLRKELTNLGYQPYLPQYLRNRLLNLREMTDLPLLNVPPEIFEKKGVLSKRQFFSRLATLVTDVGLAFQRARLKHPQVEDITRALESTFNVKFSLSDVETALSLLEDLHMIRKVGSHAYEFEPLSVSKHVSEIIEVATITWQEEKRGCTLDDFMRHLFMDETSLEVILQDLETQGLCRKIDDEYWFLGVTED